MLGHGQRGARHHHGGGRSPRPWGYFDSSPVVYYTPPPVDLWQAIALLQMLNQPQVDYLPRLADPSQVLDPLFRPELMVDLSQGIDLSRTRGTGTLQPLPGPSVIGLYGLFEDDFEPHMVGAAPPRPRGLLVLGQKKIKKVWKPRRLRG